MSEKSLFEVKTETASFSIEKLGDELEARASVADPTGLLPDGSFEVAARTDGKVELKLLLDFNDVPGPDESGLAEDEGIAEYGRLAEEEKESAKGERSLTRMAIDDTGGGFGNRAGSANGRRGRHSMRF